MGSIMEERENGKVYNNIKEKADCKRAYTQPYTSDTHPHSHLQHHTTHTHTRL